MAIYHLAVQVASRSKGKSAVAMAAYRSGEKLRDERTGEVKTYRRAVKPETMILAPDHAPAWAYDRQRLWNEVERVETRSNAQLCREINVALPVEFDDEQQRQVLQKYVQTQFVQRGMIADIAIHRDHPDNPHAHIMLTLREITPNGFGEKMRAWNTKEELETWRAAWATACNRELEAMGLDVRIDHRSLAAQGREEIPTIHEGYAAREMERRGQPSDRCETNRQIRTANLEYHRAVEDLQEYRERKARKERVTPLKRAFTPEEVALLRDAAKEMHKYVTIDALKERERQLDRWQRSAIFARDPEVRAAQIRRIGDEQERLSQLDQLFQREAERFFEKYYLQQQQEFAPEEKVYIVDETVRAGKLLTPDEMQQAVAMRQEQELERTLDEYAYGLGRWPVRNELTKAAAFYEQKFNELAAKYGVRTQAEMDAKGVPPKDQQKLIYAATQAERAYTTLDALDELLDKRIEQMFDAWPDIKQYFDAQAKEQILLASRYLGRNLTPEDIDHPPSRFTIDEQRQLLPAVLAYQRQQADQELPPEDLRQPVMAYMFAQEVIRDQQDPQLRQQAQQILDTVEQQPKWYWQDVTQDRDETRDTRAPQDLFDAIAQAVQRAMERDQREQELARTHAQKQHLKTHTRYRGMGR